MNGSYALNPDIAIPTIVSDFDKKKYGAIFDIPYKTVQMSLNAVNPNYDHDLQKIVFDGIIYVEFSNLMKPFLELVRWKQTTERFATITYYSVRKVIDSITWQNLSSIGKQYYIPIEAIYKERHRVNQFYAELSIPPRGAYGSLVYSVEGKTIKENGQTSQIPAGCSRTLARLRDGSLLELYALNYNPVNYPGEVKLAYSIIEKLLTLEPELAKRYFFADALTNELSRPAYRLNSLLKQGILEL